MVRVPSHAASSVWCRSQRSRFFLGCNWATSQPVVSAPCVHRVLMVCPPFILPRVAPNGTSPVSTDKLTGSSGTCPGPRSSDLNGIYSTDTETVLNVTILVLCRDRDLVVCRAPSKCLGCWSKKEATSKEVTAHMGLGILGQQRLPFQPLPRTFCLPPEHFSHHRCSSLPAPFHPDPY